MPNSCSNTFLSLKPKCILKHKLRAVFIRHLFVEIFIMGSLSFTYILVYVLYKHSHFHKSPIMLCNIRVNKFGDSFCSCCSCRDWLTFHSISICCPQVDKVCIAVFVTNMDVNFGYFHNYTWQSCVALSCWDLLPAFPFLYPSLQVQHMTLYRHFLASHLAFWLLFWHKHPFSSFVPRTGCLTQKCLSVDSGQLCWFVSKTRER